MNINTSEFKCHLSRVSNALTPLLPINTNSAACVAKGVSVSEQRQFLQALMFIAFDMYEHIRRWSQALSQDLSEN